MYFCFQNVINLVRNKRKDREEMEKNQNINVVLTYDQAETVAEHFGKNIEDLQEYEVGELIDRLIDEIV